MQKQVEFFLSVLKSARPRQWIKNLSAFAAIIFSGDFFNANKFYPVFYSFLILCFLTSSVYLINDILDEKQDKFHPFKKNRPIPSGKLSKKQALLASIILSIIGLAWGYQISLSLFSVLLIFLVVELSYSLFLKNIIILDFITIASAFMIRIFVGSIVVLISLSSWLILTTMMLALFLAIGKRRLEVTLLGHTQAVKHRKVLNFYPSFLLDGFTFMSAVATLITYSLFTFNEAEFISRKVVLKFLPTTLASPKWLMSTIPLVVYGIFRYLYLIYEKREGESPEKVLLNDFPLFLTVMLWITSVFLVVYVLGK